MSKAKNKNTYLILGAVGAAWAIAGITTVAVVATQQSQKANVQNVGTLSKSLVSSSSKEVVLNFKVLSKYVNTPLVIMYEEKNKENATKFEKDLRTSTEEFTISIGSLDPSKTYSYTLKSRNNGDVLTTGEFSTISEPILEERFNTTTSIGLLISNLDKSYLGRSLTVQYKEVTPAMNSPFQYEEAILADNDIKPNTDVFRSQLVVGKLKPNTKYIFNLFLKNKAGQLLPNAATLPKIFSTKAVPTISVSNTYSYNTVIEIDGLKTYSESISKAVKLKVDYTKSGDGQTTKTEWMDLTGVSKKSFQLKGLEAATQYNLKFTLWDNNIEEVITGPENFTTKAAVAASSPVHDSSANTYTVSVTSLTNLGNVDDFVFAWVSKPTLATTPLQFSKDNSLAFAANATTTTTGEVVFNLAGENNKLVSGRTYVGQVFAKSDKEFKYPLLQTNLEFSVTTSSSTPSTGGSAADSAGGGAGTAGGGTTAGTGTTGSSGTDAGTAASTGTSS